MAEDGRAGRKIPVKEYVDVEVFTPRQRDVIREIGRGKTVPEVADTLDLADGTIRQYVKDIAAKIPGSALPMTRILLYAQKVDA